jgi:hypothetical protein
MNKIDHVQTKNVVDISKCKTEGHSKNFFLNVENVSCCGLNSTFRYMDNVLSISNNQFQSHVDSIYRKELEIKDAIESSTSASYLDVLLKLDTNGKITIQLYDKRDDFNFSIVNFLTYVVIFQLHLHMVYIHRSLFDMQELARHTISF